LSRSRVRWLRRLSAASTSSTGACGTRKGTVRAMPLRTCLRCDWEGDTLEPACPNCSVLLYVVGPSSARETEKPTANAYEERSREAATTPSVARSDEPSPPSEPPPSTDAPESSDRSAPSVRTFGVLGALALTLAVGFWLGADRQRSALEPRTDFAPTGTPAGDASPTPDLLVIADAGRPWAGRASSRGKERAIR
jgi:hypothetical protein